MTRIASEGTAPVAGVTDQTIPCLILHVATGKNSRQKDKFPKGPVSGFVMIGISGLISEEFIPGIDDIRPVKPQNSRQDWKQLLLRIKLSHRCAGL